MMGLETLKNISKDKKKEKLIYILIIAIILFIASSYIFKEDKKVIKNEEIKVTNNNLEEKLSKTLSDISGVNDVSVMITYSNENKINPVYNITEEEKNGVKLVNKQVVYNEESGSKKVVVEYSETPKIEGVLIVGVGLNNLETISKVATAVSALTNVSIHKIQIFEKGV